MSPVNDNNFDKIESYLMGQMSSDEQLAFEQELNNDPALELAFKQQSLEHTAMQMIRQDMLMKQMQAWKAERDAAPAVPKAPPLFWTTRRIFQIAVAASFLLVAGYFINEQFRQPSTAALAAYYPSIQMGSKSSGATPTANDSLEIAKALILETEYQQAEQILATYGPTHPKYAEAQLYLADCSFKQKNYEETARRLRSVLAQSPRTTAHEQAEFRLLVVLAIQKKGKSEEAKQITTQIMNNPSHSFKTPAKAIIELMK
jgi:tetratricopeptide (TPR) repeat protein